MITAPYLRDTSTSAALTNSSATIDRVVRELNAIGRDATFAFAMSVGALIINGLYGGDLQTWRSRGRKHSSFRKLAQHPNLAMSADSIYRCVAIYEVCERLGPHRWEHLCTSHFRLVLPLPAQMQERLLMAAESGRWPVSQLRQEIAAMPDHERRAIPKRGGRKPASNLKRTAGILDYGAKACSSMLATDPMDTSPESCRELLGAVGRVREACARIEQRFASRLSETKTDPLPPHAGGNRGSSEARENQRDDR